MQIPLAMLYNKFQITWLLPHREIEYHFEFQIKHVKNCIFSDRKWHIELTTFNYLLQVISVEIHVIQNIYFILTVRIWKTT
jgi:hypothetical protein